MASSTSFSSPGPVVNASGQTSPVGSPRNPEAAPEEFSVISESGRPTPTLTDRLRTTRFSNWLFDRCDGVENPKFHAFLANSFVRGLILLLSSIVIAPTQFVVAGVGRLAQKLFARCHAPTAEKIEAFLERYGNWIEVRENTSNIFRGLLTMIPRYNTTLLDKYRSLCDVVYPVLFPYCMTGEPAGNPSPATAESAPSNPPASTSPPAIEIETDSEQESTQGLSTEGAAFGANREEDRPYEEVSSTNASPVNDGEELKESLDGESSEAAENITSLLSLPPFPGGLLSEKALSDRSFAMSPRSPHMGPSAALNSPKEEQAETTGSNPNEQPFLSEGSGENSENPSPKDQPAYHKPSRAELLNEFLGIPLQEKTDSDHESDTDSESSSSSRSTSPANNPPPRPSSVPPLSFRELLSPKAPLSSAGKELVVSSPTSLGSEESRDPISSANTHTTLEISSLGGKDLFRQLKEVILRNRNAKEQEAIALGRHYLQKRSNEGKRLTKVESNILNRSGPYEILQQQREGLYWVGTFYKLWNLLLEKAITPPSTSEFNSYQDACKKYRKELPEEHIVFRGEYPDFKVVNAVEGHCLTIKNKKLPIEGFENIASMEEADFVLGEIVKNHGGGEGLLGSAASSSFSRLSPESRSSTSPSSDKASRSTSLEAPQASSGDEEVKEKQEQTAASSGEEEADKNGKIGSEESPAQALVQANEGNVSPRPNGHIESGEKISSEKASSSSSRGKRASSSSSRGKQAPSGNSSTRGSGGRGRRRGFRGGQDGFGRSDGRER